ncbi:MAG: glutathione S-transferase family protein [Pseudomonadota bacterium]
MYTVIGATRTRTMRVMWMLEELRQPYRQIDAGPASDIAREYNVLGKIPALVVGDDVLTDSVAIMTYLADKHGKMIAPAGSVERAKQDAMTHWLIDEFDAILWTHAKHSRVFPEAERVPGVIASVHGEFMRSAEKLSARLEGDFLFEDAITVSDLLAVHCLNWAAFAGFPKPDGKLVAWARSMRHRPAYQAAMNKQPG